MNATIVSNEIPVRRESGEYQPRVIIIDLPEGWDTLKKLTKKVLEFEGAKYTFRGWNSDRNEAYFHKNQNIANII